ncbi:MAG: glutamine--fructose-6-phosphate transaminase (isomerizing) [Clostridia bacterium]|nr:glutamine--fructose-6-phosphate transaminase (isomerizing) [Clostridia bacterium]
MCGIVGYIGNKNSAEILVEGLKKLEYRGYDSAGIAVFEKDGINLVKTKGRMKDLEDKLAERGIPQGVCGIGHTRWATHGAPSDINSHPHRSGRVTIVHNGIIENYAELREELEAQGRVFLSQTDTECVSHTIDSMYNGDPIDAIYNAIKKFRGSYALAVLFDDHPETLYAIRHESPLIVGIGEGENFIASDIPAILSRTNKYYLLESNELAIITAGGIELLGADRAPIEKDVFVANWDVSAAEKGGYPHFMIKEIHEQPRALRDTICPRLSEGIDKLFDDEAQNLDFNTIKRIYIVACGSAMHAGMIGRHAIEKLARVPVQVEVASEFRYDTLLFQPGDAVLLISQSGETADTLAALRIAKANGVPTIAIVNVVGSSIAREADMVLYTWAGPEIAVATTKAYTCQVSILLMLAMRMAYERGTAEKAELERLAAELNKVPEIFESMLSSDKEEEYKALAESYKDCEDLFFIGRGYDSSLCWEASIKLKEVSYIHSEAYAAGELKHGTISLIDEGYPVVGIATSDAHYEKTISNVEEVLARGARVILLCNEDVAERLKASTKKVADDFIAIPLVDEFIRPLAAILPLQIFSYYAACARGCDVDKPKNLAKSVTVE